MKFHERGCLLWGSLVVMTMWCCIIIAVDAQEKERFVDQEALDHKPTKDMQKRFPYYLSGFDEDGSPIWIFEYGHWDVRKLVEETGTVRDDLTMYMRQMFARFASPHLYAKTPNVTTWIAMCDMDGYDARQLSSVNALQHFMIGCRLYAAVLEKYGHNKRSIIINGNYIFKTAWNLGKPLLGQFFDNIELHGTNSEKWIPQLRKFLPKDQLPEYMGGNSGFKPVKVFG